MSKQNGKILVSRQFVEMSRSRIEGKYRVFTCLLINFSLLINRTSDSIFETNN